MARLMWDKVGKRVYEIGLDRGVLYLPDGSAVPWNGLTAVIEKFDKATSPVYYEGMKISDLVVLGDFSASMKAVTYPDEFSEVEGMAPLRNGMFLNDQPPQVFGLCYRTKVGNDLEGEEAGYKIHILYNVTAIPKDKTYATISAQPSLVEFEWDIVAVPEEVPGFRPTAHLVIDSRDFDPWLMEEIEEMLYGGEAAEASLIPMPDLVAYIKNWYRIKIIDNGDGSWTALSSRPESIQFDAIDEEIFTILGANVVYLDDETFVISDTYDIADIPQIKIIDNGDGTWTATTEYDNLFATTPEGWFQILNANAVFVGPQLYEVSDTPEDN